MLKLMTKIEQKIPEGWSVKKLGDCCSMSSGGTPSKSNSDFWNGDIPWISASAMRGIYFSSSEEKITELGLQKGSRSVNKGDLLLLVRGSMLWNYIPIGIATRKLAFNQDVKGISVKNNITNQFLLYWFKTNEHLIKNMVVGTGIGAGKLDTQELNNIKILLPPLPEQEKIAEILSCWDDGIEKLSALIEKKKIQKKALMQQLLTGKHRLKGFSTSWHEVKLGDIGIISSAGVDKKIVEGEKLVNLLNYMDVYKKDFLYASGTSMTVSAPERQIRNCNLKKGDIFFTPSSETQDDIAHSAVVMEDIANGVYSYHIVRLRPTTPIDLKFSAYAFKTNHFYKQAFSICEGSGQRYVISQDDFRNMTVFIPSDIVEQKTIAEILSKADEEIELLNKKLEAFKQEKKALMQQLLTGKIRVKVN